MQMDLIDLQSSQVEEAISHLSSNSGTESRGAIFTRSEVVEFILDLIGYTTDKPIHENRLLEPSFGGGDFLCVCVTRVIAAWKASKNTGAIVSDLSGSIRAVELHKETFSSTRLKIIALLKQEGIESRDAKRLVSHWLQQGDFLLNPIDGQFDFVVGNPPYVRQELIPSALLKEYRTRFLTMYDRADLYIPFIERSLSLLVKRGHLGFICADRWMKNRYGGPLRQLIASEYRLKVFVDMVDTDAFHSDVIAYPGIMVVSKEKLGKTRVAKRPLIERKSLNALVKTLNAKRLPSSSQSVREMPRVGQGSDPWLLEAADHMAVIRRIEASYPRLEDTGCKVGIGVATGADSAFIGDYASLDVESDRKVPLAMTRDIDSGEVKWRGYGVINPFTDGPGLVDLDKYPKLRRYLEERKEAIAGRHCAKKKPDNWYRTIDRITPSLAKKPKLLIPDIKGEAHIVYEPGELYPHHNLYYITSEQWDLRALQAVLLSRVTRLFVSTYSTKMRGGYLRFQAQYLRRLRLPEWEQVPKRLRNRLSKAAIKRDIQLCNAAVFDLYDLNDDERSLVGGIHNGS